MFSRNSQHRGRAKVYALQAGLRKELLGCKTHKEFWDFVRKRTDVRPRKAKVPLEGLFSNFKARLNYPAVVPPTFNAEQLAFNKRMAEELRPGLVDSSPRQSYTRDITIEEIEAMKRHIISHGLDTSVGCDDFSYEDCIAIPNDKLLEFFHPYPSRYRLIALECCMLKMLTLIIDRRIREGTQDIGVVPNTQNGFQDNLRTNDNIFVLLGMIDAADALKLPLYVAYLHLKNAFPNTDRHTLWVKLANLGICGPLID
ncbi:hypothetical protein C8F04DRAFT_953356, partial [Mycena alexandri]